MYFIMTELQAVEQFISDRSAPYDCSLSASKLVPTSRKVFVQIPTLPHMHYLCDPRKVTQSL